MPLLTEYLRRKRHAMVEPYLRGDVLDVGCGNAAMSLALDDVHHYVGVDFNEIVLARQRELFPQHEYHQCDIDQELLPLGDRRFNTVLMVAIIEHLANPGWVLDQVADHLHPEGRLVITTPTPWGERIHSVGARVGLFHRHAAEEHKDAFNGRRLKTLLTTHGFSIERYQPFEFGANQLVVCRLADSHQLYVPDKFDGQNQ